MLVIPLLAALQVVAPAPPAPPPPPVSIVPPPMIRPMKAGVNETLAVEVRQDGHVLWSGDLRRSSNGTASYSQQQHESRVCPGTEGTATRWAGSGAIATGFSLSIMPNFIDPADDSVRITVERTRPYGESGACAGGQGSSSVNFTTEAKLTKGKPYSFSGEGGLSMTITLR